MVHFAAEPVFKCHLLLSQGGTGKNPGCSLLIIILICLRLVLVFLPWLFFLVYFISKSKLWSAPKTFSSLFESQVVISVHKWSDYDVLRKG